jgi:hypothetical protein
MLDGISLIGLTPAGLLLIVVLMVITGRLVPRYVYQQKADEADRWRAAYEVERTARATSEAQTRELLEMAKTSEKFFSAVFESSERISQSGDT